MRMITKIFQYLPMELAKGKNSKGKNTETGQKRSETRYIEKV